MSEHQKENKGGIGLFASLKAPPKNTLESQFQSLVNRIEDEITYCKQQKEKHPRFQNYSDQISVLNATRNFMYDNIGFNLLEEYMRIYPKWDKSFEASTTKILIHEAIAYKNGQ
ncbi:hypothetical protein OQJ13_06575 [Legionella sp. PATHC035]|uniref:hypothetical protein n=1 Tax=Legionella sp. PATHC035 TaxID=2992040 RepID=UPI002242DD5E|nr:hypothetical protein [Legionella sp. PATHC035]MCW8408638.1 hypothetical protein [Legionella sp. PATHC035]